MTRRPLPIDPNPHLAAILLITSSRAGPRLVLQYPPEPSSIVFSTRSGDATASNSDDDDATSNGESDASSEDDDDDEDDEANHGEADDDYDDDSEQASNALLVSGELAPPRGKFGASASHSRDQSRASLSSSPPPSRHSPFSPAPTPAQAMRHKKRLRPSRAPRTRPMDTLDVLFGVSRDGLAKLMAPSGGRRAWNGRKLEVEARGRTFVGCPMFLRDEDERRREGAESKVSPSRDADEQLVNGEHEAPAFSRSPQDSHDDGPASIDASDPRNPDAEDPDQRPERTATETSQTPVERPLYKTTSSTPSVPITRRPAPGPRGVTDHPALGLPGSLPSNNSEDAHPTNALTMFNIVLVLAPPPWEHQARVELAFEHVARPLARAVREAQRKRWLDNEVREVERWAAEWKRGHDQRSETDESSQNPLHGLDSFLTQRSHLYRTLASVYKSIAARQVAYIDLKSTSSTFDSGLSVPTLSLQIPMPLNRPWAPSMGEMALSGIPVSSAALTVSGQLWQRSSQNGHDLGMMMDEEHSPSRRSERSTHGLNQGPITALSGSDDARQPLTLLDRYDAARVDTTAAQSISTHAALLLLYDVGELMAQLNPTDKTPPGPLTPLKQPHPFCGPLTYLIQALSPRRTLAQLARLYLPGLTLVDITFLSCVLIRLRIARAITPLHASSFFAVDPAADLSRTQGALGEAFAARFCTSSDADERLPPLPALLSRLTGATPWASLIPSKAAKPRYMDALSWLARSALVVQIRTFAWVHVSSEVRRAVAAQHPHTPRAASPDASSADEGEGEGVAHADPSRALLLAAVDARRHAPAPASDAGSSTGSVRTAVPARAGARTPSTPGELGDAQQRRDVDAQQRREEGEQRRREEGDEGPELRAGLVRAPARCSAFEARCVAALGARLEGEEARRAWGRLVRYFDGETAVEEIAGIEGLKRKAVAAYVGGWVEAGLLRVVRHW